jgi:hypothetical protein
MRTQLQPTPVLYGQDARAVLDQIKKKQTSEQRKKLEARRERFSQIRKKGLY